MWIGCLFNLTADPTESDDVAKEHPGVVNDLIDIITSTSTYEAPSGQNENQLAQQTWTTVYQGYLGPFLP